MKIRNIVLTVALCLLVFSVCYAAENPNIGTWKLNESKSKIPAGVGKNTTVVYSAAAGDMFAVTTDGVDGSGKPAHSEWTGKFDGKPYPVRCHGASLVLAALHQLLETAPHDPGGIVWGTISSDLCQPLGARQSATASRRRT